MTDDKRFDAAGREVVYDAETDTYVLKDEKAVNEQEAFEDYKTDDEPTAAEKKEAKK